jgi:hypothetical protein
MLPKLSCSLYERRSIKTTFHGSFAASFRIRQANKEEMALRIVAVHDGSGYVNGSSQT